MKAGISCVFLLIALAFTSRSARAASDEKMPLSKSRATVIYDDIVSEVAPSSTDPAQLWISTADLKRSTHFEVKPQGVCREELCFPLPKERKQEFVRRQAGVDWFNLTAFAQLVRQPVAHEPALHVWYFGQRVDQQQRLASLEAPNFTLPDINGKPHSLADFRGKKVLLVTWASW
jgi:AhpC/TSA family